MCLAALPRTQVARHRGGAASHCDEDYNGLAEGLIKPYIQDSISGTAMPAAPVPATLRKR